MKLGKHQLPVQTPFYYGWVVVMMGGLGFFFAGPGQTYTNAIFIDAYIDTFQWSRSLISSIYSGATLAAGFLIFFIGKYLDYFGARKMSIMIGCLLGLACFWNSMVVGPITLFIGFLFIRLLGQGAMTLVPNALVPQWFIIKRGRALSFMAVGMFLSSAAFPPLSAWLIDSWGWQFAWQVLGILLLIIYVPAAFLFIRNKPEDVGLHPDNLTAEQVAENKKRVAENQYDVSWTLKEAMRTRVFWLILLCVGIPAMVNTGITFHLVSIFGESGITPITAAFVLSIMAIVGFPTTFVTGFIAERIRVHYIFAIAFVGQLLVLLLLFFVSNTFLAILFGIAWGIINGIERIVVSIIWPNYFGRKHIGSIKGAVMTVIVAGSAFGPLPFGVAYDVFGGYREIILATMIFPVLAIVASLLSKPPVKTKDL